MFKNMEYELAPDAMPSLEEYVRLRKNKLFFSNARSVRNAVDLARMAAANRVYKAGESHPHTRYHMPGGSWLTHWTVVVGSPFPPCCSERHWRHGQDLAG
jgi:hypothetical protein